VASGGSHPDYNLSSVMEDLIFIVFAVLGVVVIALIISINSELDKKNQS
jgi:hypothetical protein